MCVDLPGAASQVPVPEQQLDHIARRREVSGYALTSLMLHRRGLDLASNQLTSIEGVTFPASLE